MLSPQNGQTYSNNSSVVTPWIVWVCLAILWGWHLKGWVFKIFFKLKLPFILFTCNKFCKYPIHSFLRPPRVYLYGLKSTLVRFSLYFSRNRLSVSLCLNMSFVKLRFKLFKCYVIPTHNILKILPLMEKFWFKNLRSGCWKCSVNKVVLKNFKKFTGKHLCWSLFLMQFQDFRLLLELL